MDQSPSGLGVFVSLPDPTGRRRSRRVSMTNPPRAASGAAGRSMPTPGLAVDVQNEVSRNVGGKRERSAFHGQSHRRLLQAEHFLGIHRAEQRRLHHFHRGNPTTSTDIGLWNEGGLLSRRFNFLQLQDCASAGMY